MSRGYHTIYYCYRDPNLVVLCKDSTCDSLSGVFETTVTTRKSVVTVDPSPGRRYPGWYGQSNAPCRPRWRLTARRKIWRHDDNFSPCQPPDVLHVWNIYLHFGLNSWYICIGKMFHPYGASGAQQNWYLWCIFDRGFLWRVTKEIWVNLIIFSPTGAPWYLQKVIFAGRKTNTCSEFWCPPEVVLNISQQFDSVSYVYMGVSKNKGTPKSSILIRFSIINHPFWGTPIFGNTHIYIYIYLNKRTLDTR